MAKPYQPRMTDPVSGKKLVKGQPVPAANPKPPDYTGTRTVQPVERVTKTAPLGGPAGVIGREDLGRVKDPQSGVPLRQGQPVPTAYSGRLNQKVGIGIDAAAGALAAGFKPANAGAKAGPKLQGVIRGNADAMQQGFDSVRQVGDRAKK